jgi:predicted TPR repeat methyltransferase
MKRHNKKNSKFFEKMFHLVTYFDVSSYLFAINLYFFANDAKLVLMNCFLFSSEVSAETLNVVLEFVVYLREQSLFSSECKRGSFIVGLNKKVGGPPLVDLFKL